VISDDDEHVASGVFTIEHLEVFRLVMIEAEKFALNGDAVGTKEAITTRFMDQHQRALMVDVEKLGNQSRLFITLATETGRLSAEAGRVIRSSRREEGFFFDLLSRLESILPKAPVKPVR
jgi:hypothetical protein